MGEWIDCRDRLPKYGDVRDKELLLSDGSIEIGYLAPGKVWCSGLPVPVLEIGDTRAITHWRDYGEYESLPSKGQ